MSSEVRVRFAPSPTGYLHVGGARTALFNYLFAKNRGGKFILRIEDTDQSRYHEGALKEIFTSMEWLGLNWDEGPEVGGDCGPYFQSERLEKYKSAVEELITNGHAYKCFCTADRLTKLREEQEKNKTSKTGYDRHCRDLSKEEVDAKISAGDPYVIRLKVPDGETVKFNDMVRGEIQYSSDVLDDMVLLKTDGFPTYHLANIVDDHDMRISHVLRGDEWIASTPKHVLLYNAFGWEPPVFAHLPVILAEGGGKLSKRKGAASVMDYKKEGFLPEGLFNFLALLGWNPGDDREVMSIEELIKAFTLEKVSPKPSVFDSKKLEWMNGQYMANVDIDRIYGDIKELWNENGINSETDETFQRKVLELMKSRSKRVTDLATGTAYFFEDPKEYDPKSVKKGWKSGASDLLTTLIDKFESLQDFSHDPLDSLFSSYAEENELGLGKLILPVRLAISGVGFGAGLYDLMELLGKETVIRRMSAAIEWIKVNKGE